MLARAGWLVLLGGLLPCFTPEVAISAEYALIVGGGPNPGRNPVSLETQVLQAIGVLQARKLKRIDVLFADGDSPEPDVVDPTDEAEEKKSADAVAAQAYLKFLYGPRELPAEPNRNHRVPDVRGAATLHNVRQWFQKAGMELKSGDRLLLYFATHGARTKAKPDRPAESEVLLWNDGRLSATALQTLIQRLPNEVQVTLLMTGCYSSGFAERGTARAFDTPEETRAVAGFFSSLPDRPAAGCAPQAFSVESRDYATCFWSAQTGGWPDGAKLKRNADINHDGKVSCAEAHGFALLADNTLDTPQRRSDILLREVSRFGKIEETDLLMNDAPHDEILAVATQIEAYVLAQLSTRLKLTGRRRMAAARRKLRQIGEVELRHLMNERHELLGKLTPLRQQLAERLKAKSSDWTEEKLQRVALSHHKLPVDFVETITAQKEFTAIKQYVNRLREIDQQRLKLETDWAGYWRFIHVAESAILLHNLRHINRSKRKRRSSTDF